jgi:hypothetical protein
VVDEHLHQVLDLSVYLVFLLHEGLLSLRYLRYVLVDALFLAIEYPGLLRPYLLARGPRRGLVDFFFNFKLGNFGLRRRWDPRNSWLERHLTPLFLVFWATLERHRGSKAIRLRLAIT